MSSPRCEDWSRSPVDRDGARSARVASAQANDDVKALTGARARDLQDRPVPAC